jgi:hypothetical protein
MLLNVLRLQGTSKLVVLLGYGECLNCNCRHGEVSELSLGSMKLKLKFEESAA